MFSSTAKFIMCNDIALKFTTWTFDLPSCTLTPQGSTQKIAKCSISKLIPIKDQASSSSLIQRFFCRFELCVPTRSRKVYSNLCNDFVTLIPQCIARSIWPQSLVWSYSWFSECYLGEISHDRSHVSLALVMEPHGSLVCFFLVSSAYVE